MNISINNLIINNNSAQINATADDLGFSFDDDGDVGFIDNYGVMTVNNMTMDNSLGYYMFYNEGKFVGLSICVYNFTECVYCNVC